MSESVSHTRSRSGSDSGSERSPSRSVSEAPPRHPHHRADARRAHRRPSISGHSSGGEDENGDTISSHRRPSWSSRVSMAAGATAPGSEASSMRSSIAPARHIRGAAASSEEYEYATRASDRFFTRGGAKRGAAAHGAMDSERLWQRLMDKVLRNEDNAAAAASSSSAADAGSSPKATTNVAREARPIVGVLRRVLDSANFRHYTVRHLDRQFNRAFLIQAIGQYVASNSTRGEIQDLLKAMKSQTDSLLVSKVFNLTTAQQKKLKVNLFPNSKQSRMFALQYALHRCGVRAAAQRAERGERDSSKDKKHHKSSKKSSSSSSSTGPSPAAPSASGPSTLSPPHPVFYLTRGSPFFPAVERFCWELMLPRDSFRVIPVKRASAGVASPSAASSAVPDPDAELGIPTYAMDLDAFAAQVALDVAGGYTPVAVIATLGSEVNTAVGSGGSGSGALVATPYQMDDLTGVAKIAQQYGLWVHVEGTALLMAAATPNATVAPARALQAARGIFDLADSVSTEILGWFDLYGSMAISFFRVEVAPAAAASKSASPPPPSVQPPGMPLSRDVIANLFLLWFQLISHDESFISNRVAGLLSAASTFRARLSARDASLPFPVLVGPTGPDAQLFPQYLFFQVGPFRALPPLAEFSLDINSFNGFLFARCNSHVNEPFLAREYKGRRNLNPPANVASAVAASAASAVGAAPPASGGSSSNHASPEATGSISPGHRSGDESGSEREDSRSHNRTPSVSSPSKPGSGSMSTRVLAEGGVRREVSPPNGISPERDDDAGYDSRSEDSYSGSDRSDDEDRQSDEVEEADNDASVPLSAARRRGLLALFDSSLSLSNYQGRLGFLFHPLSSASSSSCLQSNAESKHIEWMLRALAEEMNYMRLSIEMRAPFRAALEGHPELRFVPQADVAPASGLRASPQSNNEPIPAVASFCYGIGAFQYIPAFQVTQPQLDQLNNILAHSLARKNSLYAPARSTSGRSIIVLQCSPVLLRANCISLLLHELELGLRRQRLPDDVVASLGATVEAGIRRAQDQLTYNRAPTIFKPTDLIRSVPVVGRLFGWAMGGGGQAAAKDKKVLTQSFTITKPQDDAAAGSK